MAGSSDTPEEVFGDYVLLEPLAESRTGKIFKAKNRAMGRLAALKLFSREAADMPQLLERFQRKIKILARLNHPNLVAAQTAGEHAGTRYLAMEYVDGRDLGSTIKKQGPLAVAEAVDYLAQAAAGLGHAHAQGVYHRNVKPSNLMVDRQGVVKVVGFGLAHVEAGTPAAEGGGGVELTQQGQLFGSQEYIAPEQIADAAHADQRADIYSLGCTLHTLLTGRPPYPGKSAIAQFMAHRGSPIPTLRPVRPEVPGPLDAVFQKMLAKKPEDRYQSMDEVIAALRSAMGGQGKPADKSEPQDKAEPADKAERADKAEPRGDAAAAPLAGPGGVTLDQYVFLEQLSSSRTGLVFKAQHRLMGRTVAVKFLSPHAAGSTTLLERFHRAVKILAQVEHRNLVRALEADQKDGAHYLVMEYFDGQDLRRVLQEKGPFSVAEAVRYTVQAAEGLDCAHAHGVCHRNVKPSNLLVDRDGLLKVVGFTLAHVEADGPLAGDDAAAELTRQGMMMGTCGFMAPEQALDSSSVDRRADIYSLGCTLHMLLTGHRPYAGKTKTQMVLAHRTQPIPSLRGLRAEVPEALDRVFQKMLAKQPAERYASMKEVVTALEASLAAPSAASATLADHPGAAVGVQGGAADGAASGTTADHLRAVIGLPGDAAGRAAPDGDAAKPKARRSSGPRTVPVVAGGVLACLVFIAVVQYFQGRKTQQAANSTTPAQGGQQPDATPKAKDKDAELPNAVAPHPFVSDKNPEVKPPAPPKEERPELKPAAEAKPDLKPAAEAKPELKPEPEPPPETPGPKPAEPKDAPPPSEPPPAAVPEEAARQRASKQLQDAYQDELAGAATASQRVSLAKKMLGQCQTIANDPAGRFVLLEMSCTLARKANDPATALEAVDLMAQYFAVDAWAKKTQLLGEMAQGAKMLQHHRALAEQALGLTQKAMDGCQFEVAAKLSELAAAEAGKAQEPGLFRRARAVAKEGKQALARCREYEAAKAKLQKEPGDAEANSLAGRYECLVLADWKTGLAKLAAGSDESLRGLAKKDLAAPEDAEARAAVGNGWFELAKDESGVAQASLYRRAALWYEKALPQAAGKLLEIDLKKRLETIKAATSKSTSP
jgi:serine/threonine protein kinase